MKSNDFPLPHDGISKKHSLKQALLIIYTLEERIFAAATFKGLWVFSLQSKKKRVVHFDLFKPSLHF